MWTSDPSCPANSCDGVVLFSASNPRFLCEVAPDKAEAFESKLQGVPMAPLGRITADKVFRVRGLTGDTIIERDIAALKEAWQRPLRW